MAPVKPTGVDQNPKTRQGVTGFPQEYNQEPSPSQDLNPDAVVNPSALPPARAARVPRAPRPRKTSTKK